MKSRQHNTSQRAAAQPAATAGEESLMKANEILSSAVHIGPFLAGLAAVQPLLVQLQAVRDQ